MIIFKDHDAKTNAINAVKAAFEIVDQNRAFNLSLDPEIGAIDVNIGINSGSALVGMSRFKGLLHTRMTFTATGRVTNIAARLSDHAKLGDILIGEETQKNGGRFMAGLSTWTCLLKRSQRSCAGFFSSSFT